MPRVPATGAGPPPRRPRRVVAIVTGHFPPSNLAGVHRSRLWAQHLHEFGWEPIIVTAHWKYYEEELDWDLHALVPPALRVIRTPALPTKPVRIVGDIGVRALVPLYRALAGLARGREIDFIHITIPSNFCAPLGRLIRRRWGVPYGIDYQDPWVEPKPLRSYTDPKARLSQLLARLLEPWSVRHARLVTSVAPGYIEDLLARYPFLLDRAAVATMPVGGSETDFDAVRRLSGGGPSHARTARSAQFRFVYAGTMWPAGLPILERFIQALAVWRDRSSEIAKTVRFHLIGTGRDPGDEVGRYVQPLIAKYGVHGLVEEHPRRIGYAKVLDNLLGADCVLVLGSTERHYSPSKVFQAVQSRKPVLAILHEESSAVRMLREGNAGVLVTFADGELPPVERIVEALRTVLAGGGPRPGDIRWDAFEAYSARESARLLARALDEAVSKGGD